MIKLLLILFLFCFPLNAKLIETKSPKALCSNGEQATFTFFEGNSKNWLIHFQGGNGHHTQSRLSARRSDTTAARLAEVGRRWCHCLYAPEGCVLAMERKGKQGSRRA